MTLAGLVKLALRQLDERLEDVSEYDELFRSYANMGYMIAVRLFLKPRETFLLTTDGGGRADIGALPLGRVVELQDQAGHAVWFDLSADGRTICTDRRNCALRALCEVEYPPMTEETQEPKLPEYAQPALADYICYRHLSSGSPVKQGRAEFFRQSFYQQMRAISAQGERSSPRLKNLYAATDTRYRA